MKPLTTLLALLLLLAAAAPVAAQSYEQRYENAYALYQRGQLNSAIRLFRDLTEERPDHSLADNAQYWIGEAYYKLRRYEQAILEFDRTLLHPSTNKREDALYKLAACHEKLGKADLARELYTRLLAEYPNSRHSSYVMKKIDLLGS